MAFLSYGCLSAETLLKSSIFLVLMALTGIVGRVRAPILLAQRAAFLDSHLFGDSNLVGTSTLVLTRVVALSGGFLGSLAAFSLASEFATNFSTFSRMLYSFLMLGEQILCEIILILPILGAHAK